MNGIWSVNPDCILYQDDKKSSQTNDSRRKKKTKLIAAVSAAFVAVMTVVIQTATVDWQLIRDERAAEDYIPSAQIAQITEDIQLTRKGKAIFYSTHPKLLANYLFNQGCGQLNTEQNYTLGCYYQDDNKQEFIQLYDTGIDVFRDENVTYSFATQRRITALHEILHAAYRRISEDKRIDICYDLKSIAKHFPELEDVLKLYSDDAYCTEAFARIGSEYIVPLNDAGSLKYKYLAGEQASIKRLSDIYDDYFKFDTALNDAHWANENRLAAFNDNMSKLQESLASERSYVENLRQSYYRNPTLANYYYVQNAIDRYNERWASSLPIFASGKQLYSYLYSNLNTN